MEIERIYKIKKLTMTAKGQSSTMYSIKDFSSPSQAEKAISDNFQEELPDYLTVYCSIEPFYRIKK